MSSVFCAISAISFLIGMCPGGEVLLSLPLITSVGSFPFIPGVGIFPAAINYDVSFAGSVNGKNFQALTSLHLGNWAVCIFNNGTYGNPDLPDAVKCTDFAFAYKLTIINSDNTTSNDSDAIINQNKRYLTGILQLIHIFAFITYLGAFISLLKIPAKLHNNRKMVTSIAFAVNILATFWDYIFSGLLTKPSKEGASIKLGSSVLTGFISNICLLIGGAVRLKGGV